VRARERYEQVQALKDQGKNLTTIMRELRLARGPRAATTARPAPMRSWRAR
jgi:hypothetical protein